jgi:hypothetical protein
LESLAKSLKNIESQTNGQGNSDIVWFNKTYKYWGAVLDHHKELFFKQSLTDNFRLNDGVNGINELVRGHADAVTRKSWSKIRKAADLVAEKG